MTDEILLASLIVVLLVVGLTLGLLLARRKLVPQGGLTVTVNGIKEIEAQRSDRLLGVLHGAGIGIPAGCGGSGTCGLCRVVVAGEGAGEAGATERGILSAAERKAGKRLACQTQLRGSCEVTIPDEFLSGGGGFDCTVVSNRMMAPLIRELVLELPKGHDFNFRAGGFMQLNAPAYRLNFADMPVDETFRAAWHQARWDSLTSETTGQVTRAYSIASRPEDTAAGPRGLQHSPGRTTCGPRGRDPAGPGLVLAFSRASRGTWSRSRGRLARSMCRTPPRTWSSSAAVSAWRRCAR